MNMFRALLDTATTATKQDAGFFGTYGGTIILVVVMIAVFLSLIHI